MLHPGTRLFRVISGDVLPKPGYSLRLNFSHEYLGWLLALT